MNRARADQKRCLLPSLTASCISHCILFQFNVPFYTHHSTGSHVHSVVKQYIPHFNQNWWGFQGFLSPIFYFILVYSLFTMLCQFQAYSEVNQFYIHIYPLSFRLFSHIRHQRVLIESPMLYRGPLIVLSYSSMYMLIPISEFIPPPFHFGNRKFVFYISESNYVL